MKYWLMKSEPTECSIDDLAKYSNQTVDWFGVRNYQARNFMRDDMSFGDEVLFWHSSCANPGIYGIAKVVQTAHPDSTQFNLESKYYDPKSTKSNPRWWCVDIKLHKKIQYIPIDELRKHKELENMQVLKKGNRLSITPVTCEEWLFIKKNLIL